MNTDLIVRSNEENATHRNLRFCMLTSFYPPYNIGGDGIFLYHLSNGLAARGHRVDVIHCLDAFFAKRKQPNTGQWPNHPNIRLHALQTKFGFLSPLASMVFGHPVFKTKKIADVLSTGYDIIHYHTVSLIGGPHVFSMGKGIKLKTLHTYWPICPTNFLFKYDRSICTEKNCLICSTVFAKRPLQLWRYTGALKNNLGSLDLLISPSKFVANRHHQELGNVTIETLPCFSDDLSASNEDADAAMQTYIKNGKRYFLYVGRLVYNKGVHELIRSFRGIEDRYLVIIGAGPFEKRLKALAGTSANIVFLGEQSGHPLRAAFRNAAALVVPSLWHEVFGIVAIEAMSCGTPLIVNNSGGLEEIARENNAGFVYHSPEELRSILLRFDERDPAIHAFGKNGRDAWEQRYSKEAHLNQYLQLVQSMIDRRESQP